MFQTRVLEKNQNAQFVFNNFIFEYRAVYELMWKTIVETYIPRMTIWNICIAYWTPKAKNTHSEFVIT
jgi:hypothetical protein